MVRGDFHELILLDVLQCLLQGELDGGGQDDLLVRPGSAHVGELLGLADVDVQIPLAGVLAHDHAAVDLLTGLHEKAAAVQQLVHGVGHGLAGLQRDQGTVDTHLDVALVGLVVLEAVCHDGLALGGGQEVRPQAHQAARGDFELEERPVAARFHPHEGGLAAGGKLDGGAHELLGNLDGELLDRLAALAADGLVQHLGLAHLQLEALAAHRLDEHRQVQDAAAVDDEGIGVQAGLDAEGEVLLELLLQAFLDVAGGHELAVLAEERGVVDHEEHRHRGFVDGDGRERLRILEVRDGVADLEPFDAHEGADVTALDLVYIGLAETLEHHDLLDLGLFDDVVALAQGYRHSGAKGAAGDATDGDPAHVRGVFQGGNEHLRGAFDHRRSRDLLEDRVQEGGDVTGGLAPVLGHPALLRAAVDGLEVQLLLGGAEVEHQLEDLLLHLVGTAVGLVDLVDHHDGLLAHVQRLVQHETRLGHAALERVHEQQNAVRHVEDAFHLAAEIAMAGSVDDVDFHALVGDGDVLRQDGDAALALQVVVVQDEVSKVLGAADQVGLVDHPVHEGGLAMVYVRDDRYISDVLHMLLITFFLKTCKVNIFRPFCDKKTGNLRSRSF